MINLACSRRRLLLLACAGPLACQIPNPAFGLETDPNPGATGGPGGTDGVTDGTPTTSGTTSDPSTSAGPGSSGASTTATASTDPVETTGVSPACGNAILDPGEQCDDGDDDDTDECTSTCHKAVCGDGFVYEGVEECDDGQGIECTSECTLPVCGDSLPGPGEDCDDGNDDNFDLCPGDCKIGCDNGVFEPNKEECDPSAELFTVGILKGLCDESCRLHACFRMTNTANADIEGEGWFDDCAWAEGAGVAVMVRNAKVITYFAAGMKPPGPAWEPAKLTSTAAPEEQWKLFNHISKVKLGDVLTNQQPPAFDYLYAFGSVSAPIPADLPKCPSSLGDGYAVAILPEQSSTAARVLLMPHLGQSGPRNLAGWDQAGPAIELAHAKGELMYLCGEPPNAQPFFGEVVIAVY